MKKKFYVTTAIAYPNSRPHLGHALEIIQADIIARFNKLLGKDVFFQTGTDEHGLKNWQTAKEQRKDILDFLDANVSIFKKLYAKLEVSYDFFIRTSDKKLHYPAATKLWKELVKSGDIYTKNYKGKYCTGCEEFKTDRELENGKCTNHPTRQIENVEEENYFFRLSKYKEIVAKKIKSDEYMVVPSVRKKEILSFLKSAKDISFSRPKTTLPWGIPVPGDSSQVMYVWCDALSNYITGVGYGTKKFEKSWPADVHIIGKDILRFHAAFWPAMLLSAKIPLPKKLFVHGFVLTAGAKMSKSTGNVIEPSDQLDKYGVDQFRFYLAGAMPINGDGDYSEQLLKERINAELVGNLANFCYRVMSFTNKNFNSEIAKVDDDLIVREITDKFGGLKKSYEEFDFKKALDDILTISTMGNKYFQENEPWKLIHTDKGKVHKIVGLCINLVKNLSIAIQPVAPSFAAELQKQLNLKKVSWKDINFKLVNHKIGKADIILRKIEEKSSLSKTFPLDLRVGKVLSVKDHPDADSLYVLDVDVGEKRQLVAGLKNYYKVKELVGRHIIVCVNIVPAKIRGVKSDGMLLAAEDDSGTVAVLEAARSGVGSVVQMVGYENSRKKITFQEFLKLGLKVINGKVVWKKSHLHTAVEDVTARGVLSGAEVR